MLTGQEPRAATRTPGQPRSNSTACSHRAHSQQRAFLGCQRGWDQAPSVGSVSVRHLPPLDEPTATQGTRSGQASDPAWRAARPISDLPHKCAQPRLGGSTFGGDGLTAPSVLKPKWIRSVGGMG